MWQLTSLAFFAVVWSQPTQLAVLGRLPSSLETPLTLDSGYWEHLRSCLSSEGCDSRVSSFVTFSFEEVEASRITTITSIHFDGLPQSEMLRGTMPTQIGFLTSLQSLQLTQHHISGSIPSQIGFLTDLVHLDLQYNLLSGTIPTELGQLQQLSSLLLHANNLYGPLPFELCHIVQASLPDSAASLLPSTFSFSYNRGLCGPQPQCLNQSLELLPPSSLIATFVDRQNIICDPTPPLVTSSPSLILSSNFASSFSNVTVLVVPLRDEQSGIGFYEFALGVADAPVDLDDDSGAWRNDIKFQALDGTHDTPFSFSLDLANDSTVTPVHGGTYMVSVRATNRGTPPLSTTVYSQILTIDTTPPIPSIIVFDCPFPIGVKRLASSTFCWSSFFDPESGVVANHSFRISGHLIHDHQTAWTSVRPIAGVNGLFVSVDLAPGMYSFEVQGTNAAGLSTVVTTEIVVDHPHPRLRSWGIALLAISIVGVIVGSVVWWHIAAKRRQESVRLVQEGTRAILTVLRLTAPQQEIFGLSSEGRELRDAKNVAFVFTDIVESTAMAEVNPSAFRQLQLLHDLTIRETLASCGGYEIITQGDAFELAFACVEDAIRFCIATQEALMRVQWPADVRRLLSTNTVVSFRKESTDLLQDMSLEAIHLFGYTEPKRGWRSGVKPRIRMGVHWATKGTFSTHLHELTKHLVFSGSGPTITRELADGAYGGQIIMSNEAFEQLRSVPSFFRAGFPCIEHLGAFILHPHSEPQNLFQIHAPVFSEAPMRSFPLITAWPQVGPARGTNVHVVPTAPRPAIAMVSPTTSSRNVPLLGRRILSTIAQIFEGCLCEIGLEATCFVFPSAHAAANFCLVSQITLLYAPWRDTFRERWEDTQLNATGTGLIFRGPRFAMVVHCGTSADLNLFPTQRLQFRACRGGWLGSLTLGQELARQRSTPEPQSMRRSSTQSEDVVGSSRVLDSAPTGPHKMEASNLIGVAKAVLDRTAGGQIVLTEQAWSDACENLSPQTQVAHLGQFSIPASSAEGSTPTPFQMHLMQISPLALKDRCFPPFRNAIKLSPGFFDAPIDQVTIVFCSVWKPPDLPHGPARAVFDQAVGMWSRLCRELLSKHGYECKEPDPGKFTLAFPTPETALAFCCTAQQRLLELDWSPELFSLVPSLAPMTDHQKRQMERFQHLPRRTIQRPSLRRNLTTPINVPDADEGDAEGDQIQEVENTKLAKSSERTTSAFPLKPSKPISLFQPPWTIRPGTNQSSSTIGSSESSSSSPMLVGLLETMDEAVHSWRGLRVSMGLAHGHPELRQALRATGRADYFGALPNLAARVMGQASPGQVMFEVSGFSSIVHFNTTMMTWVSIPDCPPIVAARIGPCSLKGIPQAQVLAYAALASMPQRQFPLPKNFDPEPPRNPFQLKSSRAKSVEGLLRRKKK